MYIVIGGVCVNWKKFISAGLAVSMLNTCGLVFAEQSKAEEYRNILQGDTFCVEYEDSMQKASIAEQGKKRIYYSAGISDNGGFPIMAIFNPFALFGGGTPKKEPYALFDDGKYYQFKGNKTVIMATRDQIKDPNLDPKEAWDTVRVRLSLPASLRPLVRADRFNDRFNSVPDPIFSESGVEKDKKGKEFEFDKYVTTVKNSNGKVLWEKAYYLYYLDGEITRVKMTNRVGDSTNEFVESELQNVKILAELPEKIKVEIPKGNKVYSAGLGDMDDLLDQSPLLEDYSKKE